MIIEKQKEDNNKISYLVKLNNDRFILNIYTKNKYDSKKDFSEDKVNEVKKYKYGDCLEVNGKIVIPEQLGNIGEFNYKRYLNSKGIVGLINVYSVNYVDNRAIKIQREIYKLKNWIAGRINDNLEYKEAELLKGMIYGDTKNLDEEIKDNFESIGISHITAVSGSNLTIFLLLFNIILNKFKINIYVYFFVQVFLICIFCLICDLELSVLRASIMMIICVIMRVRNRKISMEKIMIITLAFMLYFNPYRIFNTAMVFSFLSTIGIAIFYPKIYNFFESKICWNIKKEIIKKILLKISSVISITLAANILILPITISIFNTFPLIFIISNLFVSTLSTSINILGIIGILLPELPCIYNIVWRILDISLRLLINISSILSQIEANISIRKIPLIIITIYYLYIVLTYVEYNVRGNKKTIRLKTKTIKNNLKFIFVIIICLWIVYIKVFNNYVYYFNVGQGEMAIIKNQNSVIMIDSGSITNDTSYIFEGFSKKEGIRKIDVLVISHFHSDHVNGIKKIIKQYDVRYIMYAYPYNLKNEEYLEFLEYLSKSNIKRLVVKSGDKINIGKIRIDVLFPNKDNIKISDNVDGNENANSLVVNINLKGNNYLFLGDSTKESEKYILENFKKINILNIQIIKIAHHGSKTSTSEHFIKTLMPKYAIISAKEKVYNHPNDQVVNLLNRYNIKTYITEKTGGIKFLEI